MNRLSFERTKRRSHLRLTLEHLESRRVMAGLNVLVFADNDGTRSLNSAVDAPAVNRLVYVDLNRSGRFEDGEPLSVSGADGVAKFPNLAAGDYLVGLAGLNPAQIQTTSVTSDALGKLVASAETQTLLSSSDLKHVWSVSATGRVTRVGSDDVTNVAIELGGPVISSTTGRGNATGEAVAWALVDRGGAQPALLRLDLAAGSAREVSIKDVPVDNKIVGVASMGDQLVLKLDAPQESFVGVVRVTDSSATVVRRIAAPRGTLIGSSLSDRLAVIGSDSGKTVSTIRIADAAALIETATTERPLESVQFSADGQFLFAAHAAGGLEVFSADSGLHSVAYLAEAGGPVAVARADGRVVTGNAANSEELIVWDSSSWRPTSRIALSGQSGAVRALAVDQFGERILAATASSVFGAGLANPVPLAVAVTGGNRSTETSLGVRVIGEPTSLPSRVEIGKTFNVDSQLAIDLASIPTLAALGSSNLMFAPSVNPRVGTMIVTPTGRLTYRPPANASGTDSAELKLYDGINSTTVVLSLNVTPVNDPPSAFTIDTLPISEAALAGASAGYTTVFDVDADASYLITTDDPRFTVVNGQLLRTEVGELDFENEPFVQMHLTATDSSNPSFVMQQTVSVPVADANDGPTSFGFTFVSIVSENSSDFEIGHFSVDDPDSHGDYVFTFSDSRFEVVDGQLRLKAGEFLDYEQEPHIELGVTISDPTAELKNEPISGTIRIEVQDMNDAPVALWVDPAAVMPHQPGAYVGLIYVSDPDFYGDYTYTVSDPRFEVEGESLRLKDGQEVDRSAATTIPVVVTATDADGNVISETISVQVINDAPFQNPNNPLDVDNDGSIYPRDVLILIDLLNRKGPHLIEPLTSTGEGDDPAQDIYIDVNGDGYLSPLDALILINHLNKRSSSLDAEGEAAPLVEVKPEAEPSRSSHLASFSSAPVGDDDLQACSPFEMDSSDFNSDFQLGSSIADGRHDFALELDSELESLLDQLSRERLR